MIVGFVAAVIYLIRESEAVSNAGLPPNWGLTTVNRSSFPSDFIFGSSSSSFQVIQFINFFFLKQIHALLLCSFELNTQNSTLI